MNSRTRKLNEKERGYLNILLTVAAVIVMAITVIVYFIPMLGFAETADERLFFTVIYSALLIPVGLYFGLRRKEEPLTVGFILLVVAAAIAVRLALLDYESSDYNHFLAKWVDELSVGVKRWREPLGDYNMPYIYFLTVVAKVGYSPLYSIKFFSVCFDFALAFFAMKCASLVIKSPKTQIAVFLLVLFWPTMLINGAMWAQCDAIYTSLCLGALYCGMSKRPNLCMVLFALAFSFKLQTVFALPIVAVLLMKNKIRFKHLLVFPAVFFATLLPALLVGKPFMDLIMIYANQAAYYKYLTMNAPTIYALADNWLCDYDQFKFYGIMLAGTALLMILYFTWLKRDVITDKNILTIAFLFTIVIPFFLPSMHERYFFAADYFAFLPFFISKKRWFAPIAVGYVSYRSYSAYLYVDSSVDFMFLFMVLAALIGITAYDLVADIYKREKAFKTT